MCRTKLARLLSVCFIIVLVLTMLPISVAAAPAENDSIEVAGGRNTYTLFNSGRTGRGVYYSSYSNYDDSTIDNGGYDIYAAAWENSIRRVRLGRSFYISDPITERATLTIQAYDVDEESSYYAGPERDLIYLVDMETGYKIQLTEGHEYLSGMDEEWNTTTFYINPSLLVAGRTYYLELYESVSGWCVWVRNVSLQLTSSGESKPIDPNMPVIKDSDFSGSISTTRVVSTNLYLKSSDNVTYNVEYSATNGSYRYGSYFDSVYVTPMGANYPINFTIASGSPKGIYRVEVIIKDNYGNVITTYSVSAGYYYSAVNYNPAGGSYNVPVDETPHASGEQVEVLFDYIPSKDGYEFLGWSTRKNATTPEFTKNSGGKLTVDGINDVVLYAVWRVTDNHDYIEHAAKAPTCTTAGWDRYTTCDHCGYSSLTIIPAKGHKYSDNCDATCNTCGEERIPPHTSNNWLKTDTTHSGTCSVCKANIKNQAHVYDNVCDGTCNVCKYEREVPHNTTGIPYKSNQLYHYRSCRDCNIVVDMVEHTYSDDCDSLCDVCNYSRVAPHSASAVWEKDNQLHWHKCKLCGEAVGVEAHKYTNTSDKTCNSCGAVRVEHKWTTEWVTDGDHHWKECTQCGERKDIAAHRTVKDPTCTKDQLCAICRAVVTPRTGHDYEEEVIVPSSCTQAGKSKFTCKTCGGSYTADVAAGKHRGGSWIIDAEAKVGVDGKKHKECISCGTVVETVIIPALEDPTVDTQQKPAETEVPKDTQTPASSETEDKKTENTKKPSSNKNNKNDDDDDDDKKKGCFSSIGIQGASVLGVAVATAVTAFCKRKKRD